MNHVSSQFLQATAQPLAPRALSKLRTRHTVLAAAKRLFTRCGYDEATVRSIAHEAGMSTGAVFGNFEDKADLFNAVIAADHQALAIKMRRAAEAETSVEAALLSALGVGYKFHLSQLPLLQAAVSLSWRHRRSDEMRSRKSQRQVQSIVGELLSSAVDRGELISTMDVPLAADTIWQAYLGNYRLALFDGADLAQLRARLCRQIALILSGSKR
jgi:AcrR family transcriptional regulator